MNTPKHLIVAISSHGFGHFAQTACVLNALRRAQPLVRLTLLTTLPRALLETRLASEFALEPVALDFGMLMQSAIDMRIEASLDAYRAFHADWEARVEQEAARLRELAPDLVLANVPYLALAAAHRAGIPSVALCSLNWADIAAFYFKANPAFAPIFEQMVNAYQCANIFLQPTPSMAMPHFTNTREIGPIARIGTNRSVELRERMGWPSSERLIIIAPGGIPTPIPIHTWPRLAGVRWITTWDVQVERTDVSRHSDLGFDFTDLLASSDAVVTKPGYGTLAEAVCNGIPVLYALRGDWPEEPFLVRWLQQHGSALEISRAQFWDGCFEQELRQLLELPRPRRQAASGVQEAASLIGRFLT